MTYEVWAEGYAATGEHGTAQLVGTTEADSFEEACQKLHTRKWGSFTPGPQPRYWGCRLFTNEADARRSYG